MKNFLRYLSVLSLTVFLSLVLHAQVSDKILAVHTQPGNEGQPAEISVDLANAISVNQMFLNYRTGGSGDYKQIEMTITGNTATVTIPADEVVPNEIDYYFVMTLLLKDGYDTYPAEDPKNNPLRLTVNPAAPKEAMITMLSPESGRSISADDLMFAFALKNVSPLVDLSTMKLFIDGNDVTPAAAIADSLITLDPQKLTPRLEDGKHLFRIDLFSRKGQLYYTQTLKFSQGPLLSFEDEDQKPLFTLKGQLESRHERYFNSWSPYNRGLVMVSTERGPLTINGRVYATNEEKKNRQPVNQYFIEAKTSWLRVAYGDDYPTFPSLIMSGKRVRGFSGNLKLGFFNVDYVNGDVTRSLEGDVLQTFTGRPTSSGSYGPYDTTGGNDIWALYRYGTFKRSLMALRPSFGAGESFQWGFTYLKSKDDVNSIRYGINPQENLVLGSDLFIGMLDRKLQFTAQGAASILNTDISKGEITDEQIDSLFTDSDSASKRQDLRDIRDQASKYITVNQNIVPLSIDKISSILGYEGTVSLDQWGNYLKGTYLFHGSSFRSFGQSYTRSDVQGFNIYDRLRIIRNQVFLSGSFERLEDNTDDTKYATTTFTNWNGSVAYYPRFRFPNVTVGYGQNTNTNGLSGLDPAGPDSLKAQIMRDDQTYRFYVQMGYDFVALARNTVSLNVSASNTDDKTYHDFDTKTSVVTAMVLSTWNFPLQSTIAVTVNNNTLPTVAGQTDYNYTMLTLGAKYRLLDDRLRLSASYIPTFGDIERSVILAGADYSLLLNLVASINGTVIDNSAGFTDTMISFLLKYNM